MQKQIKLSNEGGTYISAQPSALAVHNLMMRLRKEAGLSLTSRGPLHSTIIYDVDTPYLKYGLPDFKPCTGRVTGVKLLDDGKIAALVLSCPGLKGYWMQCKDMGYKHSFPSLLVHISILKRPTEQQVRALKDFVRENAIFVEYERVIAETLKP